MYKSLQGCRAIAALLVVLHHLGYAMASSKYFGATLFAVPFTAGDAGVEFFFVLSGFIITWAHFNEFGKSAGLLRYLRKRLMRIYPTYWIIFGVVYLAAQGSPALRAVLPHDYVTLLKSLVLVPQDASIDGGSGAPLLTVAWSLQYEICFYALVAMFFVSRPLGIVATIPFLVNFWACHVDACSFPRSFFSSNVVLLFGLGVLIAHCSRSSIRIRRPTVIASIAASAFVLFGIFEAAVGGSDTLPVDRRLVYGLLSGIIIFALIQSENRGELQISNRWVPLLGDSSYALYLIHYPLISVLSKCLVFIGLAGGVGAVIAYPLILCSCIFAAVSFHLLVEKPILRAFRSRRASATLFQAMP